VLSLSVRVRLSHRCFLEIGSAAGRSHARTAITSVTGGPDFFELDHPHLSATWHTFSTKAYCVLSVFRQAVVNKTKYKKNEEKILRIALVTQARILLICNSTLLTSSSAVAVIADRTAYDVMAKLWNRFRLQVYEQRVRSTHNPSPTQRAEFMNAIHSSVTEQSSRSQWITEHNTTSARLIVCLQEFT